MNRESIGIDSPPAARLRLGPMNLVLVGPPGAGKTVVGRLFAARQRLEFIDTDELIAERAGMPIAQIFDQRGEAAFRRMEGALCREVADPANRVIATGGGALLDPETRSHLEAGGLLVGLTASAGALRERLAGDGSRPLLAGDPTPARLDELLAARASVYESVPAQLDTTGLTPEQAAGLLAEVAPASGDWWVGAGRAAPEYPVVVGWDRLGELGRYLEGAQLRPPYFLITDANVARLYAERVQAGLECELRVVPAGEDYKSPETLAEIYRALVDSRMERSGTLLALGGGVLLDLAGYAAATFMRGIRWVALPTTLLATVDASLGGKVGINLPQGKNLVGAFHPPGLVLADLATLASLPEAEVGNGAAELVKAALLGDSALFTALEAGPAWITRPRLRRAMEIKLEVVGGDPREMGARAALNLGHTTAHALEAASGYSIPHGQAVGVGLVAASRLSQALGRCDPELPGRVERVVARFGLPIRFRGPNPDRVVAAMSTDKKRRGRKHRFVLPIRPGRVEIGVEVPEATLREVLRDLWEGA